MSCNENAPRSSRGTLHTINRGPPHPYDNIMKRVGDSLARPAAHARTESGREFRGTASRERETRPRPTEFPRQPPAHRAARFTPIHTNTNQAAARVLRPTHAPCLSGPGTAALAQTSSRAVAQRRGRRVGGLAITTVADTLRRTYAAPTVLLFEFKVKKVGCVWSGLRMTA